MGSGLFDKYPELRIILGHLGEGLPYSMWRIDHRNGWVKTRPRYPAKKKIAEYFHANFYLTLGKFSNAVADRCDARDRRRSHFFPDGLAVRERRSCGEWFDSATISEGDRKKIGRENALRLFKLADKSALQSGKVAQAAE